MEANETAILQAVRALGLAAGCEYNGCHRMDCDILNKSDAVCADRYEDVRGAVNAYLDAAKDLAD